MGIKNNMFMICFLLALTVFCSPLKSTWAVPASYKEAQNLKDAGQQGAGLVIDVPRVDYTASGLRDPFEPESAEEEGEENKDNQTSQALPQEPLPRLNIQGIVWGGELPQAIINGQVVKIGDRIEGVRIVDISKEGISVFYSGRQQLIAAPAVKVLEEQNPIPKEE
jgi:hypothetical protein